MLAASFWLGMRWRRANKKSVWISIYSSCIIFFVLPALLPVFFQGLRTDAELLKMTDPQPIVQIYHAKEMDVISRNELIERWDELNKIGESEGVKPNVLHIGDKFTQTHLTSPRSIFWTRGVARNKEGLITGQGDLNIILVLIDKAGFDLSKNPHALNQTIRILVRIFVPFIILILVALFTRPDDKVMLDRFFAKMKTKVKGDRDADRKEMELSYANPYRFDHLKIWPKSQW